MDVQMPIMDGFQATAAIRQLEARGGGRVPIVGVTAHAMKGDRERCLAVGMDGYVTKLVRPEALFAAIAQALGERAPPAVGLAPAPAAAFSTGAGPAGAPAAQVSTTAAGPDAAVLDEASLVALVSGDGAVLGELAELYAQDASHGWRSCAPRSRARDRRALERAAHSFKGSAGSLFGTSTAEAAELLETIAGDGGPAQLQHAFDRLAGEAARLGKALAQLAAGSIIRPRARPGASLPKAH
jgi:HPt (histidine-containing phosphotransfer) domain-containing protein